MIDTSSVSRYRQYAADCVNRAQGESTSEDKTIMLNVALAWLRLAQQTEDRHSEVLQALAAEDIPEKETMPEELSS